MIDQAPPAGVADRPPRPPAGLRRRALGPLVAPSTWLGAVHLVADTGVGPVVGALVLAWLLTGAALVLALGLGLLVVPAVLAASAGVAVLERHRLALLLGEVIPAPARPTGSLPARAVAHARAASTWREVAHHVLGLVRGPVLGGAVVAVGVAALLLLASPVLWLLLPTASGGAAALLPLAVLAGLVLVVAWPHVVGLGVLVARAEGRALLGPGRADLERRVVEVTRTRSAAVQAAEAERRRIERDLHDGAQQRLVALALDLGRARSRFDSDPEAARRLVDDAHREAKTALGELRDLARGIAPSVLADRGLDAALSSLVVRCPVPVDLEVDVAARPDRTVESVAYFCVAEALTNVAKHASASRASVVVRREPEGLRVVVRDDGVGGADAQRGSGLAGLRDRAASVDGSLHVDSPPGGPTVLTLGLPCA